MLYFNNPKHHYGDLDSVVSTVTPYELDGWGLNPGGGEIFHTHPNLPQGLSSLLYNRYQVSVLGVKKVGCVIDEPPRLPPRLSMGTATSLPHLSVCLARYRKA